MERERLRLEAQPVQVYIPPPKAEAVQEGKKPAGSKPKKPEVFTAIVPPKAGETAKKKPKKKAKSPAAA